MLELQGEPGLDVSISHGDTALLVAAVAGDGRVGVDVEDEPFDAFRRAALVRRMCSATERAALDLTPAPLRRRALARAWTIKEATLKARGVGLAEDPRRVPVDPLGFGFEPDGLEPGDSGPEYAIVHLTAGGAIIRHRGC
jgi:phosphopantetheinyl transferase